MKTLFPIAQMYAMFVGASGYLFGQIFFEHFVWHATIAGVAGILAGALSKAYDKLSVSRRRLVLALCVAGSFGVAVDAISYYTTPHAPGNDYAWVLNGLFATSLIVIAYFAGMRSRNHAPDPKVV